MPTPSLPHPNPEHSPRQRRVRLFQLLGVTAIVFLGLASVQRTSGQEGMPKAVAVTKGPEHHFFGYYDKCPWDKTGRYLLTNESSFVDRQPKKGELLRVGMIDLKNNNKLTVIGTTPAWCWQQGTMLQWLGSGPDRQVIHNSVDNDKYISVITDIKTGKVTRLPLPIYALSTDGTQAVSLDFARLGRLRPGYGYVALPEKFKNDPAPKELGVWWMDVETKQHKLIVSLNQLSKIRPKSSFRGASHWVNHLLFNPSGTRILFLHRWGIPGKRWETRLYTVNPDGSDLSLVVDTGRVSHFDWKDDTTILAWSQTKKDGRHFYLFEDKTGKATVFMPKALPRDGHCSYSPDRRWLLNDTYPDELRLQTLMLIRLKDNKRFDVGRYYLPPQLRGPFRCDLHPRWNRDGTKVCFDSAHEGTRQMYVVDVSSWIKKKQ
ncbi:MAG: hypothetical protein ACFCD0_01740 [Gemmataceae bacterium]